MRPQYIYNKQGNTIQLCTPDMYMYIYMQVHTHTHDCTMCVLVPVLNLVSYQIQEQVRMYVCTRWYVEINIMSTTHLVQAVAGQLGPTPLGAGSHSDRSPVHSSVSRPWSGSPGWSVPATSRHGDRPAP